MSDPRMIPLNHAHSTSPEEVLIITFVIALALLMRKIIPDVMAP